MKFAWILVIIAVSWGIGNYHGKGSVEVETKTVTKVKYKTEVKEVVKEVTPEACRRAIIAAAGVQDYANDISASSSDLVDIIGELRKAVFANDANSATALQKRIAINKSTVVESVRQVGIEGNRMVRETPDCLAEEK